MKSFIRFLLLLILFVFPMHAYGQGFEVTNAFEKTTEDTTYKVNYDFNFYFQENSDEIDVELDVTITNLRSDVYVTEFSLKFPQNFLFRDLRVSSTDGDIPFVVSEKESTKNILFKFPEPTTGSQSQNKLKLRYTLDTMHTYSENTHELVLPLLVAANPQNITAKLHFPEGFDKKASLAKPRPDAINFNNMSWEDIDAKALYVLFGESETYATELKYNLQNNGITPKREIIALPPETTYQKIYIENLDPQPEKTFTDKDGNFLAEYKLLPRTEMTVTFQGYIEVFVRPQSNLRDYFRTQFSKQKASLLTSVDVWGLGKYVDDPSLKPIVSAQQINQFVIQNLSYDEGKLLDGLRRDGAIAALKSPTNAICVDYSDVFIAVAREKGIAAREIQGFGYSTNENIRPQSLAKDILHSWVEYYDEDQQTWQQLDPTWQDTSGIDYFESFDVNHIAFAIHGSDPQEPRPAGLYKTSSTQDVQVARSDKQPVARQSFAITHSLPTELTSGKQTTAKVQVTNTGNTFAHNVQIVPQGNSIVFDPSSINVQYLAPYETAEYTISLTPQSDFSENEEITFSYGGDVLGEHDVRVISSLHNDIRIALIALLGIAILSVGYIVVRKNL